MKSLKEKIMGKCKHFNGLMSKTCEKGIGYETLKLPKGNGQGLLMPCWGDEGARECPHACFPTEAEADAEVAEIKKRTEGVGVAREAIVKFLGGPWRKGVAGSSGTIPCPVCQGGPLRVNRSGHNGHIHAACSTENCVSWME